MKQRQGREARWSQRQRKVEAKQREDKVEAEASYIQGISKEKLK